jgi:hypothetical protein
MRQWLKDAKRCGAKTRRGTSCNGMAMPNGRCRMHGGTSPGAPKVTRMPGSTGTTQPKVLLCAEHFARF